ncbi:SLC13 family permease [Natranaerofaba carboxydovora]|uniref:SLC13 family permease n=1 Tax=Natranaerofaba carboxydovora TaxID=2742683 RepID=UPI001F148812|nr:DASS family sodium-coupled anion symporter [Natranaerofaba carboxydovora]UMZ74785.1 Sodium-dependent dicarboxylate transporter SdcS [Natranaerofaba carboxydovora]
MNLYKKIIIMAICAGILVSSTMFNFSGLDQPGMMMIAISLVAALLWGTEIIAIPITGLTIIFLQSTLGILPLEEALSYIASPVNSLILVGFVLASALKKYDLDRDLSIKMIKLAGTRTSTLLFCMMVAVAVLSMWIANTSTTAIMIPIAVKMLQMIKGNAENIGKAFIIGIAYAGSIGGIATPIGTTPNPITIGFLQDMADIHLNFLDWIFIGLPFVILLIPGAWFILLKLFPPETEEVEVGFLEEEGDGKKPKGMYNFLAIFALIITLWLLDSIWTMPNNWIYIVSLLGVLLLHFPIVGVLNWKETTLDVDWGVIILIGGGLSLGNGLQATGVIDWFVEILMGVIGDFSVYWIGVIIVIITGLSLLVFCSITATSTAFVPIAISMAFQLGVNPVILAAAAGVASSFAFFLPANTPPNAIAYSSGYFETKDMMKAGAILLVLSILVFLFISATLWNFIF